MSNMQETSIFPDSSSKPATNPPRYDITGLLAAADLPAFYFGYGSNMRKDQMIQRCPQSKFIGIGCLDGWRWQINERGYANVVENMLEAKPIREGEQEKEKEEERVKDQK